MTARPSLTDGGLDAVWELVRRRLEREGLDNRGRVRLPELSGPARLTLGALLGTAPRSTVDLGRLEAALRGLDVGDDLPASLAALGFPVSTVPAEQRAERAAGKRGRDAARSEAASWPEPWAPEWIEEVIRAGCVRGMDAAGAVRLVQSVRTVLDALSSLAEIEGGPSTSRVDLAARLLGSSHALDTGTRLEAATTKALARRLDSPDPRALWEQAGAHLDLTSGAVLTWNLPVDRSCGLASIVAASVEAGVPLHLTQFALRRHPLAVVLGVDVLAVENPRVVEAAAQAGVAGAFVATNGNPSGAVRLLLQQLLEAGATVRYHGDFDAAGIAMCARLHAIGLTPWRMDTSDYVAALAAADADGVELPTDPHPCGPTPWDPALADEFGRRRLIVHEERLLPTLLAFPPRA